MRDEIPENETPRRTEETDASQDAASTPAASTESTGSEAAPDAPASADESSTDGAKDAPAAIPEPLTPELQALRDQVEEVVRSVYDPEIPVNIYELGMVYEIKVTEPGDVEITMTLTSPACPVAGTLPGEVEAKVQAIEGVRNAKVNLVWEPPWHPDMMSEAAKLQLNIW